MKSRRIAVVIHKRVIYGRLQLSLFGAGQMLGWLYGAALPIAPTPVPAKHVDAESLPPILLPTVPTEEWKASLSASAQISDHLDAERVFQSAWLRTM